MLNGINDIEGLTPEQIEAVNKLADGLVSKKTELETKLSKTKQAGESSAAELERLRLLEQGLEQAKLEEKENYNGALELVKQENQKALEKLTNSVSEKDQLIHKLLVENGLNAELVALNVNPDLMGLIQQGLSAAATVVDGKAMIGEESLSDYMKTWAETPQGKASILAKANTGGDATGGNVSSQGKKMAELTDAERLDLYHNNKAEFDRLKAEMA